MDQKEAAHRILVELVNIFKEYEDDIRIVGGWVPDLMFPGEGHIGSVDVDVLINHLTLHDEGYQNMARTLQGSGYREHPDKYFSFVKTVEVEGEYNDKSGNRCYSGYSRKQRGRISPERKQSWQQLISPRMASHIICIANIMRHCSVKKKSRVWLRCAHVR